ncbi:hypothetical protein CEXT_173931 [Caerostris extrusa]|uniref:Uncharacterized protein n=1 Tax=Caerostris extrusa TaxID=172846 RepID=A0AAV4RX18_CAEEX|nr:hypothetical protein CEXT_173931 [Caerostris extrusa]
MKEAQIADCVSIAKHIELETTTQEMKPSQDGRPSKIQNGNSPPNIIKSDISEIAIDKQNRYHICIVLKFCPLREGEGFKKVNYLLMYQLGRIVNGPASIDVRSKHNSSSVNYPIRRGTRSDSPRHLSSRATGDGRPTIIRLTNSCETNAFKHFLHVH